MLQGLLADWEVTSAVETTLAADLRKEDLHRYQWKVSSTSRQSNRIPRTQGNTSGGSEEDLVVSLQPMEIRTFILTVKKLTP